MEYGKTSMKMFGWALAALIILQVTGTLGG